MSNALSEKRTDEILESIRELQDELQTLSKRESSELTDEEWVELDTRSCDIRDEIEVLLRELRDSKVIKFLSHELDDTADITHVLGHWVSSWC